MRNFTNEEIKKLSTKRLLTILKIARFNSPDFPEQENNLFYRIKKELNTREHIER